MDHGIVDVFAFQEALLIEAIFAIAVLAMIWAGFRRWLQHKEKVDRLIAEQAAARAAQYGAHMERVEARLDAIDQVLSDSGLRKEQLEIRPDALPETVVKSDGA